MTAESLRAAVWEWLQRWADCVRRVDLDGASELFAEDVVGFGTRATRVEGLGELRDQQWREVWPHSDGFVFDRDTLRVETAEDASLVAAIVEWSSVGYQRGRSFERPGRATILLRRSSDGLRAVHTHFSMERGVEAMTHRSEPKPEQAGPSTE